MDISPILARLETIPEIAGSIIVGTPMRTSDFTGPKVWISRITEDGLDRQIIGQVSLKVVSGIGLTIGASTYAEVEMLRGSIDASLLGFIPSTGFDPMSWRSGRMVFDDPAWAMWYDEYKTGFYRQTY